MTRTALLFATALATLFASPSPAPAQIKTSVVVTTPQPCAAQVGAPPDGLLCDADGLLVHAPNPDNPNPDERHLYGDGGDTAQREGWYWLGVWLRQNTPGLPAFTPRRKLTFDQVLALLEPNRDGVFYRHPKLAPWNNPFDKKFGFSRDQMEPLVAAMGVWGKTEALRRLWDALPEDVLGKHSFNGRYKNALGQDGWDCAAIKRRGCDATRDCSLKTDTRDCSLKVDTRNCSLQEDTRSCSTCIVSNPFGGCFLYGNDPFCEAAKAAQNLIYKGIKDKCEVEKGAQNALYAGEKTACEAAKATQNAIYAAEKGACETVKATEKATCEANKTADLNLCRLSNYHDGDFIGPMTENLFSRAMNQSLAHSLGEPQLLASTLLRIAQARDRDDVGDDLNLIVKLLMAKLRSPSRDSEAATAAYASHRPFSYGSYLRTYRARFDDATDMVKRIQEGIRNGWRADKPAVNGAVHWYHRVENGGNSLLAELYDPIIDRFIYGDRTGTFSTLASQAPAPTIARVAPAVALSSGGTAITISGTGFLPGTSVLVAGAAALDVTIVNETTIRAIAPAHASGPTDVSVTVPWPAGGSAIMDGAFTYVDRPAPPLPVPSGPRVSGDFNGDGRPDLIWQNRVDGRLAAWFMNGTEQAEYTPLVPYQVNDTDWHVVGSGDANRDGQTDLYWQHQTTGELAVWFMNQTEVMRGELLSPARVADTNWKVRTVADLDVDGYPDLIWQHTASGDVAVWYMTQSTMRSGELLTPGRVSDLKWKIVAAGDMNQDGQPDLFWHHAATGQIAVWFMRNNVAVSGQSLIPDRVSDLAWQIRGATDLDGNGSPDLIWQNTATQQLAVWLMKGLHLIDGRLIAGLPPAGRDWHVVSGK